MHRRELLKAAPGLLAGIGALLSGFRSRESERTGFAETESSDPIVGTVITSSGPAETMWVNVSNGHTGSIAYYTASH